MLIPLLLVALIGCGQLVVDAASSAATSSSGNKKKPSPYPLWQDVELASIGAGAQRESKSFLFRKELQRSEGGHAIVQPDKKRSAKGKVSEAEKDLYAIEFVQDILEVIYKKQHPRKEECKSKRLLTIQMSSTSFEGTGSLLKQVMLSMSIAMHSNRTAMWGLGYPFLFEHSRDVWDGEENDNIQVNNDMLDCSHGDPAAGAYDCFFEPLSPCSLADATPAELVELSENPHNSSARIILSEITKGVAMYHPPAGLFEYIFSQRHYPEAAKQEILTRQAHLWAGAVCAYVFRIKPHLAMAFAERAQPIFAGQEAVWGMHVRHGDLKALSNVYAYKEIYDFEDYFDGALALSQKLQFTPSRLFVATDSIQAEQLPSIFAEYMTVRNRQFAKQFAPTDDSGDEDDEDNEDEEEDNDDDNDDEEDDEDEDEDEDENSLNSENSAEEEDDEDNDDDDDEDDDEDEDEDDGKKDTRKLLHWFDKKKKVDMVTIGNNARYRTAHGSHTVAANGGCLRDEKYNQRGMRCALNYEAIVHYQTLDEHRLVPRAMRLMRVLLESIEDIYLLARCDALIAQGSSHFSTVAAMLLWARTGAKQFLDIIEFLDMETIQQGFTPTAFLHGMNLVNGTHGIDDSDVSNGAQRWAVHTNSFISGLPQRQYGSPIKLSFDPWALESRIRMVNNVPHIYDKLFALEAKTWLGGKYRPTIPGMCPGKIQRGENPVTYVTAAINLGVDHLQVSHYGQALLCWRNAMAVLADHKDEFDRKQYDEFYSVAKENAATLRVMRYAEMAINENHNTKEYNRYSDKYMKRSFDGIISQSSRSGRNKGNSVKGEGDNEMMSLEDVNEDIAQLEEKLKQLKLLRDRLIAAHYSFINGDLGKYS